MLGEVAGYVVFLRELHFLLAIVRAIGEMCPMKFALPKSSIVLVFALAACGGGSTPTPKDSSEAAPKVDDQERAQWMKDCVEQPGMDDFCSCSFELVVKTTTAEERKDPENPNTKQALSGIPGQCGKKLPVAMLKEQFNAACAKKPVMGPYCECTFEFLHKRDLVTADATEIQKVEGEMKQSCSAELYQVARDSFLGGCGEKLSAEACTCTFAGMEKKVGKDKLMALFEAKSDDVKKLAKDSSVACGAK